MDKVKKTWREWANELGIKILDPDGFRNKPQDHLYTEDAFHLGLIYCTIEVNR